MVHQCVNVKFCINNSTTNTTHAHKSTTNFNSQHCSFFSFAFFLCCDSPNNTPLWRLFSRTTASDEIFFPTLLSLLGLESYLVKKQITMVDWEGFTKNPRTYEKNQLNIAVKKGRDIGAMNVRKFRSVDMEDWCKIVLNSSSK